MLNANQNWLSSGSRHSLSSSNLYVGRTTSGSFSELRTWSTALSVSKFRLHTLNKFSTVGNTILSNYEELIYRYRLNENYNTSSVSASMTELTIVDSATSFSNYNFTITSSLATGSTLYGYDNVGVVTIGLQDAGQLLENNNKVIIDAPKDVKGNLNPYKPSHVPLNDGWQQRAKRNNSLKLDINRSPQDFVNNFIIEKIQGENLELKYANPINQYSSSYKEFDDFREDFFKSYPISIDTNRFIKAHENIFNEYMVEGIKKIIPARSTLSDPKASVGVTIKPTILEKPKIKRTKHSLEINPNYYSSSIDMIYPVNNTSGFNMSGSIFDSKNGTLSVNDIIKHTGSLQLTKDGSVSQLPYFSSSYEASKDASFSMLPDFSSNYESSKNASLGSLNDYISEDGSAELPKTGSSVSTTPAFSSSYTLSKNGSVSSLPSFESTDISSPKSGSVLLKDKKQYFKVVSLESNAGVTLTFANTASNNNQITLTSFDNPSDSNVSSTTSITYMALSSSVNGALSSSLVLFATGSHSSSAAGNLAAAITSSNGHGSQFTVSQVTVTGINDSLTISQSSAGHEGNTSITSTIDGLTVASSFSGGSDSEKTLEILKKETPSLESSIIYPITGTNNYIATHYTAEFRDLHAEWGTGVNDTHFLNMATQEKDRRSTAGSEYNVNHIESRFHFYMIGDIEIYSSSFYDTDDFSNAKRFYNRQNISTDIHKNTIYESYINGTPGTQKGRAIGKTRYFMTSSDGSTITFPSNHVRNFSNPFVDKMYEGTQNINAGFMNAGDKDDLSSASFYRVKVTGGERQLIVRTGYPTIGPDDKIIY